MQYRLQELAALASEMGLNTIEVDETRLDIVLWDTCRLAFCNLEAEQDTLVGFDGTPWHAHGTVQFLTGERTHMEVDELELLIGIGTGELVVVSSYAGDVLKDRWLAHKNEPFDDVKWMKPGEELRVRSLRTGQERRGVAGPCGAHPPRPRR